MRHHHDDGHGSAAIIRCVVIFVVLVVWPGSMPAQTEVLPWQRVLDELQKAAEMSTRRLRDAHAALLPRARAQDPALVTRLTLDPPALRPTGYGILPEVVADDDAAGAGPRERRYSLEELTRRVTRAGDDTRDLLRDAAKSGLRLVELISRFEKLRDRLRNIESHLSYHSYWQSALAERPAFFAERNEVIALLRERRLLADEGAEAAAQRIAKLDALIAERVSRFKPVAGLRMLPARDGTRLLALRLQTDIDDERFLHSFCEAVDAVWNGSDAARGARLSIVVSPEFVPALTLYPHGAPARGQAIDLADHLARFPADALVLTTGARSTHAWTGRSVVLGPAPLSKRTLAHEFGHLLGFDDGYLRGYEGDPADPYGAVLVEWSGITGDLMGSPGRGAVSAQMIARLIAAYDLPQVPVAP